jgi:molybdate/tungstate transport system substrate-binding protein
MRKYLILLIGIIALYSCEQKKEKLVIFHAGSLSTPFKELADSFVSIHPQISVQMEIDGSVACARKITELDRRADLMASADIKIIQEMLIPDYTKSALAFAGNEMVLAYHDASAGSDSLNAYNWPQVLLSEETAYGRSNPDLDPCGYRSILCMKLQEKFLAENKFTTRLLAKDQRFIRPKETDLLALLETRTIDYMFIYKSVATQHKLKFLNLNDTVNLGKPELDAVYQQVSVQIQGSKPGDTLNIKASPMTYGICELNDAPNPEAAKAFMELLRSKTGIEIMERNGQNSLLKP